MFCEVRLTISCICFIFQMKTYCDAFEARKVYVLCFSRELFGWVSVFVVWCVVLLPVWFNHCVFRTLIEFDAVEFRSMSFLCEWHDFFFIVASKISSSQNTCFYRVALNVLCCFPVELSSNFPAQQPEFVWQSVYHEGNNHKPYVMTDNTYPYSPRWPPKEMAERAKWLQLLDFTVII